MFLCLDPINEAYFGKTPEVMEIQDIVTKLRKKYTTEDEAKKIIKDPLILDFESKVQDTFGFKKVYFGFDKADVFNCYTLPIRQSKYGDLSQKYTVTKTGIRYNKEVEAETLIVATKKLFFCDKLTDEEVMSTMLHEIGHNFTDAVVPITLPLEVAKSSLKTYITTFLSATKRQIEDMVPKTIDALDTVSNMISRVPGFGERIAKKNEIVAKEYLYSVLSSTSKRRYIDEKFADQFTAMYGYGPALSSVLVKIDYNRKNIKDAPLTNFIDSFYGLVDLSMDIMFGGYPMLSARLKSSVSLLEHEIEKNDSIPPELKKELEDQIKDIDLLAMQYSRIDKNSNYSVAKKTYFSYMYNCLKDGDFFSKFIYNTYNLDKIDKNLDSNKK